MKGRRHNVYIRKEISDRMKDYPEVNWSGLATAAFKTHMERLDTIRAINKMHKDHMEKEYGPKV